MVKSFNQKRPNFNQFRSLFLVVIAENLDQDAENYSNWLLCGDERERTLLLAKFRDRLVQEYNMGEDLEIQPQQINLDGTLESVITQLFHKFSTMSLVEHINESILGDYKGKYNNDSDN
ncbi:MAG: hypothetical protein K9L17_11160 [Clostridiales bacterium]|nr:hypothetical protein [Clostridiales bacterium]MCF8023241.1 hypothetical protein [Clostridiales bacterium]